MKKIIVSEDIINNLISEYLTGKSLNELSQKYKLTRAKIKSILLNNAVELRTLSNSAKLAAEKAKITNLNKYGVENVFQAEEIKSKIRSTCEARYGVAFPSKTEEVKQKVKNTSLEKFGVQNALQSEEIKLKVRKTSQEKWGLDWPGGDPKAVAKTKATKKLRYGRSNYNNLEKAVTTCLEHHGVAYGVLTDTNRAATTSQEARIKANKTRISTCQQKYGVDYYFQTLDFHKKARKIYEYDGETFDSKPELALWIYAKINNIPIIRHPKKFVFKYDGVEHLYFPDFEYNGQLLEIKGDHFFTPEKTMCCPWNHDLDGLYEAKHQCGILNNVIFLTKKDYEFYIDFCIKNNIHFEEYLRSYNENV